MTKKKLLGLVSIFMILISGLIYGSVVSAHQKDQPPPPGNLQQLTDLINEGGFSVRLEPVADGLIAPNWGTTAPGGDTGRMYVTDQPGILWAIDLATGDKTVFLDVSGRLVALGIAGPGTFDERGLLGVAFHPDYIVNGLLYTYTSQVARGKADFSTMPKGDDPNHHAVITEWQVRDPTDSDSVVDPRRARVLLRIAEPQFNHDGGAVNFGHDGMLYISLGDGGGADDEGKGHGDNGNGQDPGNVLGAILRIDPLGSDSANRQYGIPADNPFVGVEGFLDEIYAYGFRNPYRFSVDSETGDIYVGDVGQNDIEEVDVVVSGGNYGWRLKEGSFFFDPDGTGPTCNAPPRGCATEDDPGDLPTNLIDPIAEYDTHTDGHSVIGGFVYRGSEIEQLAGRYVFGEFARRISFGFGVFTGARLFYLNKTDVVRNNVKTSKIQEFKIVGQDSLELAILGFGQDADGELYVLANTTGVPFGAGKDLSVPTGVVLKIVSD